LPESFTPSTTIIPKTNTKFSATLVEWFEILKKYYVVQDYQFCLYQQSLLENETDAIEGDSEYLHELM